MDLYKGLFVVVSEGKLQKVMPAERVARKDGEKYFKAISRGNYTTSFNIFYNFDSFSRMKGI